MALPVLVCQRVGGRDQERLPRILKRQRTGIFHMVHQNTVRPYGTSEYSTSLWHMIIQ